MYQLVIVKLINKNIFYLVLLALILWGCGGEQDKSSSSKNKPQSHGNNTNENNDLQLTLTFAKDDTNSLHQALAEEFNKVKDLETKFNGIFNKMGLPLRIKDSRLTDELLTTNLDKYFQIISWDSSMQIIRSNGVGSFGESIFVRKLAPPGFTQEQIQELSAREKNLVFPTISVNAGKTLLTYRIEIPFRTLLGNIFSTNALYLFNGIENKTGEAIYEKLISASPCQDIENLLTKFVDDNFRELGKITDIKCSQLGVGNHEIIRLDFTMAGKNFDLVNNRPLTFYKFIQELLLMKYDLVSK